jgi:hypothetical protein
MNETPKNTEATAEKPMNMESPKEPACEQSCVEKPTTDVPKECPIKGDSPAAKTEKHESEKKDGEKEEEKDEEKDVKVSESEEEPLKQEPKRARSAYNIFVSEQTPIVKKEHPDISRTGME